MSVPAGIMQALQQGAGASGPGGAPGGAPASITIPPDAGGSDSGASTDTDSPDEEHWLTVAKAALQKAEAADEDHIESETILKCIAAIQGILSKRQSGAESAFGVTPAHKAMSRAY